MPRTPDSSEFKRAVMAVKAVMRLCRKYDIKVQIVMPGAVEIGGRKARKKIVTTKEEN